MTSWLSRQGGGIPPVIWSLAQQMTASGLSCSVAGLKDQWNGQDIPPSLAVVCGSIAGPVGFGYSPELSRRLAPFVRAESIVHSHGLWMYSGWLARRSSRRARCPLVISPHGMLEPWALRNSRCKKRVASWLFEDRNLRSAHCLHALCDAEAEHFRRYGLRNPIAIIPNGVNLAELDRPAAEAKPASLPDAVGSGQKVLLFLSRLHPKKGLDNLLRAWRTLASDHPGWRLVIAGAGDAAYVQTLKDFVRTSELSSRVGFCGPVYGNEKYHLLAASAAFVLPSFSEGFSMAILEAAAAGLPVMLTPECNFPELVAAGAALEVPPEATAIEQGLRRLLALSDDQRKHMGLRGQALIRQSYTWPVITARMCQVYQWLFGQGPQPECVHLD